MIDSQMARGNENIVFKLLYLHYYIFRGHRHSGGTIQRFSWCIGFQIIFPGVLHMADHLIIGLCTPLV